LPEAVLGLDDKLSASNTTLLERDKQAMIRLIKKIRVQTSILGIVLATGVHHPYVLWRYVADHFHYALVERGVLYGSAMHVAAVRAEFEAQTEHGQFKETWHDVHIVPWCVTFSRIYNRVQPVRILEIGSWEGRSTLFFLTYFTQGRLTALDTWAGSDEYHYNATSELRDLEARFDTNIGPYADRLTKRKGSSMHVLPQLLDERQKFDLIYVDGSHFPDDVLTDAINAWRLLEHGGLLIFDDFFWNYYPRARANPRWAINLFLKYHTGEYTILSVSSYQIILQKKKAFRDHSRVYEYGQSSLMTAIPLKHKTITRAVARLPIPAARRGLNVYHKALRIWGPELIASTYFGGRLGCDLTDVIQRMIVDFGVWEPDVSRTIEHNLHAGDVFVDIGANIGYDSLLAASRVGASGRVVAIEASPRTFGLLQDNLARNTFATNVRAVNVAVSDRPGKLRLYEFGAENIGAATTLASRGGSFCASVDALPLRDILMPEELRRLRLIKIDVEGAEPPIVRSILSELTDYPTTMDIVVEASPDDDIDMWRDLFNQLQASGFSAWAIENNYTLEWYLRWRPTPLRRLDSMPTTQQDLLLTRRERPVLL
jgi:FkbM family methyltransferase